MTTLPKDAYQYLTSAIASLSNLGTITQAAGGSITADVSALLTAGTIGANGTTTLGDITTQNVIVSNTGTACINLAAMLTKAIGGTQADNR